MVDLETLGTGHNAVILSIGAVKFDPHDASVPMDRFYVRVSAESCVQFGLTIDPQTVMWWMNKDRAGARESLFGMDPLDLPTALEGFSIWMGGDMPVWGNGATFDNVILRHAFKAINMDCPWKFWNDRCYRTMKNIAPKIAVDTPIERIGTHHNALDDAMTQANHLQRIFASHILEAIDHD